MINTLSNILRFLKHYSITELMSHNLPINYQELPETREFTLYEKVWWRGKKWYIISFYCVYHEDHTGWKLELENYPCKYSSHNIQYVDSREVKKIIRCGELNES